MPTEIAELSAMNESIPPPEIGREPRQDAPGSKIAPRVASKGGVKPSPAVVSLHPPAPARPRGERPVLQLIVDSREQRALPIPADAMMGRTAWRIETEVACLPVGDYAIKGWSGRDGEPKGFTLERKSLADLVQSLSWGRERFLKEMERAREFETFAVIVEDATMDDVRRWRHGTEMTPASLEASVYSLSERFRAPVLWFASPQEAAVYVVNAARRFLARKERLAGPPSRASP